MIKTETAKKWGGTVTIPLTAFLEENKKYVIQDAEFNNENVVIIREDKNGDSKLKLKSE